MQAQLRNLSEVVKSVCFQDVFEVTAPGGSVSLHDQLEKLKCCSVNPDFLDMTSKFGYIDEEIIRDFPWPEPGESSKTVSLEMKFLPKHMFPEEATEFLENEGFRSATLQEFLILVEEQHPANLTSIYAIFDKERKEVLVAHIDSSGLSLFPLTDFPGKVLSRWVIPCVCE